MVLLEIRDSLFILIIFFSISRKTKILMKALLATINKNIYMNFYGLIFFNQLV